MVFVFNILFIHLFFFLLLGSCGFTFCLSSFCIWNDTNSYYNSHNSMSKKENTFYRRAQSVEQEVRSD